MKKLIFILLISFGVQSQTLTVSGTTYEITGSELLTILNSYNEGYNARLQYPFNAPVQVQILNDHPRWRHSIVYNDPNQQYIQTGGHHNQTFKYAGSRRDEFKNAYIILASSIEEAQNLNGFVSLVTQVTHVGNAYGRIYLLNPIPTTLPDNWKLYMINY